MFHSYPDMEEGPAEDANRKQRAEGGLTDLRMRALPRGEGGRRGLTVCFGIQDDVKVVC